MPIKSKKTCFSTKDKYTGLYIIYVTFKLVIKRAKRIVYTGILCSASFKLFRVILMVSFTFRHISFLYGSGTFTPSERVIFAIFQMMKAGGGMDWPRVRPSTESHISRRHISWRQVWRLFSYQKI